MLAPLSFFSSEQHADFLWLCLSVDVHQRVAGLEMFDALFLTFSLVAVPTRPPRKRETRQTTALLSGKSESAPISFFFPAEGTKRGRPRSRQRKKNGKKEGKICLL
nr:hypothetical protein [Pandoravirus massiliensis]